MADLSFYVGVIGNVISVLMFLSPVSTFIRIVKHRSTEDFDSLPYVCTLLNSSLWTYYGLINDEVLVSTINGFGALVEIVYVALFLTFAPRRMKVKTGILVGTLDIGFCGAAILVTRLALQGNLRIGALGMVCAALNIIMYGSPLAAMKTVVTTKSVEYMPFLLSFFLFLNGGIWAFYAVLHRDIYLLDCVRMDGSSTSLAQYDSQETQHPEVPLQDVTTLETRVRLVPYTDKWFGDRDVAQAISETIRTYYKDAFTCWRDAPADHKRFWWNCFKERFTWDPEHEDLVRREWQQKVRVRLKDIVHKAAKDPPNKILHWMTDDIRTSLHTRRDTDEEFKKRSERNRRNKIEGPKAKIGHNQGSISATMWAGRLTKQLGRRPSAADLFATTHSKVDESGQRIWCDAYAQSVYEKYEQLKVGTDVQVGSAADDHLFFKASGGWTNKGTIYGLGREAPAMFEKPITSRRSGSSAYSSPVVTQLQDQLQVTQNELQTTQSRLHSTEDELRTTREELSTTRHELEATRKQLDEQRIGLLDLNARFDSLSALLGHPTRADNSQASSQM